jgi:hypothetical protein
MWCGANDRFRLRPTPLPVRFDSALSTIVRLTCGRDFGTALQTWREEAND